MKKAIAAALALTLAAAASGQTVGVAQMPSSTTLGGRIDFEKIRTLPASSAAVNWLFANVPFLRQEGLLLGRSLSVKIPDDLDSLLLFSDGFAVGADNAFAMKASSSYVNGRIDTAKIDKAIRATKGFKSAKAGSREALTGDFARGAWLACPADGLLLVSSSEAAAKTALLVYEAKSPSLSPTSPIAGEIASSAPMTFVASGKGGAKNLSLISGGLIQADAELAVARLTETTPGTATLDLDLSFATPAAAAQVAATLNGLKMLAAFNKGAALPDSLLKRLMATQIIPSDKKVAISFNFSASDIAGLAK